jgi:hypothetical protein
MNSMNDLSGILFGSEIASAARAHRVDPILLAAVAAQETGGPGSDSGRNITGDGGHGHGVFQIDDRYHAFARSEAASDPARNADYAAGMLRGLLDRYGGDPRQALSAYNSGSPAAQGTVTTWGDGRRLGYADSVLRHYSDIAGRTQARETLVAALPDDAASANALSNAYAARLDVQPWSPPASQVQAQAPSSSAPAASTPATPDATGNASSPQPSDGSAADADLRLAALANPLDDAGDAV